mgnify:CR=1 FL=1
MLTYHLKPHDQQPLYEQLYHAVRADIMSGALPGGTRLPSKRQLAANLRVSQITVETAYGQLSAEGYIASAPRRGYFVQEQLAVPVSEPQEPFTPPLSPISASEETYPYDFRTDFVDNGCFPFSTWARLSRSVLSEYSSALLRATDPCGAAELREEIVRYLHDFRGINVSPDNILIGAGSEYLMHLVIQLLGRDRVYALENPGYRKLYQIFAANGVTVRPTPLDKHGLRADALAASDASVVYLTPSHHFPLGTVMTAARRLEILRWVSEAPDRYIIEDDYDSEFRYRGKPIPALQGVDRTGKVIYIGTFSKSIAPAIRISYLVLPEPLLATCEPELQRFSSTVSRIDQMILNSFLKEGHYERHLNRMRAIYGHKQEILVGELKQLSGVCTIRGEDAGVHLLLEFSDDWTEAELIRRAEAVHIRVYPLSEYSIDGADSGAGQGATILLGYATMTEEELAQAARSLTEVWR